MKVSPGVRIVRNPDRFPGVPIPCAWGWRRFPARYCFVQNIDNPFVEPS
ncbi:MAG: hypothetical protein IPP95_00020 [Flavobacteriales bacterium]|nr:MAG: hypothetical protein IPP95_00020 [Flavobacteriales bacterium]